MEAGKIRGLNEMDVAGSKALDYGGKLYPLAKALESNSLSHDKRGLLTRKLDMVGPEFGKLGHALTARASGRTSERHMATDMVVDKS